VNNVIAWSIQVFDLHQLFVNLFEQMFALDIVDRPSKVANICQFLTQVSEEMTGVDTLPNGIVHLFHNLYLFINLIEVVRPVNCINWALKFFQICNLCFQILEHAGMVHIEHGILKIVDSLYDCRLWHVLVRMLYAVARSFKFLQSSNTVSNFIEMVLILHLIHWTFQFIFPRYSLWYFFVVVLPFNIIKGTSKTLQ